MEIEAGRVHVMYVKNYSVKYSLLDNGDIRVTIPMERDTIKPGEKMSVNFRMSLKECSWSDIAIDALESYLLAKRWESPLKISPTTGDFNQ